MTDRVPDRSTASSIRGFWGLCFFFGLSAALLEWLRVDPTFGTSVSVWLFFPMLAVVWRGFWAGIVTALVAAIFMLLFSRAMFLPFDAAVFIVTSAAVGWCCAKGQTSRVIDGVLLSWLVVVPAGVLFHLDLYRRDMNAGMLITTTMLLSQLVPAMLAQWLAFTRRPLAILDKIFGPRRRARPVHMLVIVRAVVLPMILLPLLVIQYFFITQSLLTQTALQEQRAVLYGEALRTALEDSLVSFVDSEALTEDSLLAEAKKILDASRAELPSNAILVDLQWADSGDQRDSSSILVEIDPSYMPRSPIDWIVHRQVVVAVLGGAILPGRELRVTIPFVAESLEKDQFKIWGLLSALLFLVVLEALYRLAMLRLIRGFDRFSEQIANWVPGQPLEVIGDMARGRINQVDQYAEGVAGLVADFNENYRALSATNAERRKLLARVNAILRSVSEPIIVTNARLMPIPNFCNELGKLWSQHLRQSLAEVAGRMERSAGTSQVGYDPFVDTFAAAIRGDQAVLNNNLTLVDWEGKTHEFGLSLGIIGAQPGQQVDTHSNQPVDGYVILLTDLSKLLTQQWEKGRRTRLESLENVASGVAHEINQPLNVIRMASKNLLQKAAQNALDPAVLKSKLERIDEQVDRVASLITTMRAFSSSETKEVREIDPNALIQNIITLMSGNLRAADVDLASEFCDGPHCVMANSNTLGHAFSEVIQNAIEALQGSPVGQSRRLAISTAVVGGQWQATFEDNGCGIPEDALDRLYEPFFTTKEQAVHSGFGLHEASRIIAGFEGALEASNGDDGARFTISLPLIKPV